MRKEIGARIKVIRISLNYTIEEFSDKIGITPNYLEQIEQGKIYISIEALSDLCKFTNLSSDYILFGKPEPRNLFITRELKKLSNEQIDIGCEMLKNLAFFIKGK